MSSRASMTSRWPTRASDRGSRIPLTGGQTLGVLAPAGTWPSDETSSGRSQISAAALSSDPPYGQRSSAQAEQSRIANSQVSETWPPRTHDREPSQVSRWSGIGLYAGMGLVCMPGHDDLRMEHQSSRLWIAPSPNRCRLPDLLVL